jgi:hypothetical protein
MGQRREESSFFAKKCFPAQASWHYLISGLVEKASWLGLEPARYGQWQHGRMLYIYAGLKLHMPGNRLLSLLKAHQDGRVGLEQEAGYFFTASNNRSSSVLG